MTANPVVPEVCVITAQLFDVADFDPNSIPAVGAKIVVRWMARSVVVTLDGGRRIGCLPPRFDRRVIAAPADNPYCGEVTSVERGLEPTITVRVSRG